MAFILTQPVNGGNSGDSVVGSNITGISIPPSSTVVVDSIPLTDLHACKWIYTITDTVLNKVRSAEVLGTFKPNYSAVFHTVSATIGDTILHGVTVAINGSDLELRITNNTSNILDAYIVRIQVI